jgi:hypothetical protein
MDWEQGAAAACCRLRCALGAQGQKNVFGYKVHIDTRAPLVANLQTWMQAEPCGHPGGMTCGQEYQKGVSRIRAAAFG